MISSRGTQRDRFMGLTSEDYKSALAVAAVPPVGRLAWTGSKLFWTPAKVAGTYISWETTLSMVAPFYPAVHSQFFGSYKGDRYEPHIGFGYEETLPMKKHPSTAWIIKRQRMFNPTGRNPPWANMPIPSFGFGWGSRKIVEGGSSASTSQQRGWHKGDRKQVTPPSAQTKQDALSSAKRGFGGGIEGSRPRRRGSRSRDTATSRTITPMCPVHNVRHWCNVTRAIVSKR